MLRTSFYFSGIIHYRKDCEYNHWTPAAVTVPQSELILVHLLTHSWLFTMISENLLLLLANIFGYLVKDVILKKKNKKVRFQIQSIFSGFCLLKMLSILVAHIQSIKAGSVFFRSALNKSLIYVT